MKTPLLIHQPSYNMLNRWIEKDLLDVLAKEGAGCIPFSALAQGILTDKYLNGIPKDSRVNRPGGDTLRSDHLSDENLARVRALNDLAKTRGQTLAQMAVAWVLRDPRVTTALIGASTPQQIKDNVGAIKNLKFSAAELATIDKYAQEGHLNLWEKPSTDQRV
jgi:L-glyceraldehyde 3-phosphate reductase